MPPKCKVCGEHYWSGHPCKCAEYDNHAPIIGMAMDAGFVTMSWSAVLAADVHALKKFAKLVRDYE